MGSTLQRSPLLIALGTTLLPGAPGGPAAARTGMLAAVSEARDAPVAPTSTAVEAGEPDLETTAEQIGERLAAVERKLIQTDAESRQDPINFPPRRDTQIGYLARYVNSGYWAPGRPARERLADLAVSWRCTSGSRRW